MRRKSHAKAFDFHGKPLRRDARHVCSMVFGSGTWHTMLQIAHTHKHTRGAITADLSYNTNYNNNSL